MHISIVQLLFYMHKTNQNSRESKQLWLCYLALSVCLSLPLTLPLYISISRSLSVSPSPSLLPSLFQYCILLWLIKLISAQLNVKLCTPFPLCLAYQLQLEMCAFITTTTDTHITHTYTTHTHIQHSLRYSVRHSVTANGINSTPQSQHIVQVTRPDDRLRCHSPSCFCSSSATTYSSCYTSSTCSPPSPCLHSIFCQVRGDSTRLIHDISFFRGATKILWNSCSKSQRGAIKAS